MIFLNVAKTKVMVFRKGGRPALYEKWFFDSYPLEVVSQYVYLGVLFSSSGLFVLTKKYFIKRARMAMGSMWPILINSKLNSIKIYMKLFRSLIFSVLTYGSAIWAVNHYNELEVVFCIFFQWIFKLPQIIPGYLIRFEIGCSRISVLILELILRFWIKILELPDYRYVKICYYTMYRLINSGNFCDCRFNWAMSIKNILDNAGFSFLWLSKDPYMMRKYLPLVIRSYCERFIQEDWSALKNNPHCVLYDNIKTHFFTEFYLVDDLNYFVKCCTIQLRFNVKCLRFFNKEFFITHNETCRFCTSNQLETSEHILFNCKFFGDLRAKFMISRFSDWRNLTRIIASCKKSAVCVTFFLLRCCNYSS